MLRITRAFAYVIACGSLGSALGHPLFLILGMVIGGAFALADWDVRDDGLSPEDAFKSLSNELRQPDDPGA